MLANIRITMTDPHGAEDSVSFNAEAPTLQGINDAVLDELERLVNEGFTGLRAKRTVIRD